MTSHIEEVSRNLDITLKKHKWWFLLVFHVLHSWFTKFLFLADAKQCCIVYKSLTALWPSRPAWRSGFPVALACVLSCRGSRNNTTTKLAVCRCEKLGATASLFGAHFAVWWIFATSQSKKFVSSWFKFETLFMIFFLLRHYFLLCQIEMNVGILPDLEIMLGSFLKLNLLDPIRKYHFFPEFLKNPPLHWNWIEICCTQCFT